MNFSDNKPLNSILNGLIRPYAQRVPDVKTVTSSMKELGLISKQEDIVNDHIAFRTLGVPNLGISSFERIFLHHGYTKQDHYFFFTKEIRRILVQASTWQLSACFYQRIKSGIPIKKSTANHLSLHQRDSRRPN